MGKEYYIKGSVIQTKYNKNELIDFSIKCTCEHCGYKFNQTKDNCIKEEEEISWAKETFIRYKFNNECPNCSFKKVKDNRHITAQKRKDSRDLTQKVTDAAVRNIKRHFTNIHVGAKEIGTGHGVGERVDAILFSLQASFLIETKISRADFLKDKEKEFRKNPEQGMGDYRYFACPTGLIKPEELPDKWGLIYVDEKFKDKMIVGYQGFDYNLDWKDLNQPSKTFRFDANLYREKDLLISLCKRYKTKTGVERLV